MRAVRKSVLSHISKAERMQVGNLRWEVAPFLISGSN